MKTIKRAKWAYLGVSVAIILLGIILIFWPRLSATVICIVGGIAMIVFGCVKLFGFFSKDRFQLAFQFDFAFGIFMILAGLVMLVHTEEVVEALPVLMGVMVLIDGSLKLQTSLEAKRFGMERWWGILALAVLTCICGMLLVLNPYEGAAALTIFLGITLIVDGVQNLCVVAYTVRILKQVKENSARDIIDVEV